ncbi:hypothetical protein GCM10011380_11860 [Sphingomonas metalli]|uniref:Ubiquinol-cytochrome c chaperone domain-containing protein n=1 Tax=Sphingomonas metalli TaxID=1779358 RepID=A0A916SZ48_9SPHN|nr:ubiquinol-cytochrome C chaperone family protein [Sphingomonas metalli]GGB23824.1 hypothetical protein GCM10011380_11860 [Sphingomonas metalli]
MTRLGWLASLFGRKRDVEWVPLYNAVVARARAEHWYEAGAVPDTVDGRFDMIAAVLSMVLIRLEAEPAGADPAAHLAEHFVDDMDAQLRQIGFGDMVVGKQVGRMMSALGGRLGAYREALAAEARDGAGALDAALVRNLYRGDAPAGEAVAHVAAGLRDLHRAARAVPIATLHEGALP